MTQKAVTNPVKTCTRCGQAKPLDMFYKDARSPDKKGYWCKECTTTRQKELKEAEEKKKAASNDVAKQESLILTIDFTSYPDLLKWLAESAEKDFRSTEMQLLYWLKIEKGQKESANGKHN